MYKLIYVRHTFFNFRYMEMMETLNGTTFFGEESLLDMLHTTENRMLKKYLKKGVTKK